MDVSIIIVNYNTLKLTKQSIDSVIEKTKDLKYEIILIDNNSIDGSVEFFKKKYKDRISFIENKENIGFGKANNKGIEIAKGKYIFLLNSDTLLINNAIKILFDFMEKNENCGVCGGNLYDINLQPTISYELNFPENTFKNAVKRRYKKNYFFNKTEFPLKVAYVSGADMMIRKKVLNQVDIFDFDFFMYYEETELTFRIANEGYKVYNIPQAKIIHLEGKSNTFKEKKYSMILESKYKYFYKTANLKICKNEYYISQISYIIKLILTFNKKYLQIIKINKREYNKFLLNYKSLRRNKL